jgi:hypothetical protein
MADFKTHMLGAAAVSGVLATGLFMTGNVQDQTVVGYFVLGVIGGLLPDIDSDTSIPLRVGFNLLAVVAGFMLVFIFGQRYSLVELVILWLVCFLGIRYGVFSLFTRITVHRGLIHSIPAGIFFGLLTTVLAHRCFGAAILHAWLYGTFLFMGFLVHLLLDEFFSVNLLGMELKNSFGTALNLGSLTDPLGTFALYSAIIGLFYLSPPVNVFIAFISNSDIHRNVLNRLLPDQGWFTGLFHTLFSS